jgi:hypothetical protein
MRWIVAGEQSFLQVNAPLLAQTVAARYAMTGELQDAQPAGPGATTLRRVMTELQMLMHEKLTYASAPNAVWLWGGGEMPQLEPKELPLIWTNDAYSRGIYRAHSATGRCKPLPRTPDNILEHVADAPVVAVLRDCSVADLEEHWFAPVLRALDRGTLQTVALYFDGWWLQAQRSFMRRMLARPRPITEWLH